MGMTFESEYFREFESENKNNSGYESGVQMGSVNEKNKMPKIFLKKMFQGPVRQGEGCGNMFHYIKNQSSWVGGGGMP
jgi:hypothetical protein